MPRASKSRASFRTPPVIAAVLEAELPVVGPRLRIHRAARGHVHPPDRARHGFLPALFPGQGLRRRADPRIQPAHGRGLRRSARLHRAALRRHRARRHAVLAVVQEHSAAGHAARAHRAVQGARRHARRRGRVVPRLELAVGVRRHGDPAARALPACREPRLRADRADAARTPRPRSPAWSSTCPRTSSSCAPPDSPRIPVRRGF